MFNVTFVVAGLSQQPRVQTNEARLCRTSHNAEFLFNETDCVQSECNKREQPLAVTNGIQTEETCISGIRGRVLVSISHVVMS